MSYQVIYRLSVYYYRLQLNCASYVLVGMGRARIVLYLGPNRLPTRIPRA